MRESTPTNGKLTKLPKVIAFYLPQFYRTPYNDEWWGSGFTEWVNVAAAKPAFEGHVQPKIPAGMGFYDTTAPGVIQAQVELAKKFLVDGFCFYYYWFDGERLLEKPLDIFLESKSDFPFMISWANENWTATWDGGNREVLKRQGYLTGFEEKFIQDAERYLKSPKYITSQGLPVLSIYRPEDLPNPTKSIELMKKTALQLGLPGLKVLAVKSFGTTDPREYGADGLIELPPLHFKEANFDKMVSKVRAWEGGLNDIRKAALISANRPKTDFRLHPGIMPSWDNTPRRPSDSTVFVGETPELFKFWLAHHLITERENTEHWNDEGLVFINAWNEWAEGACLEPDATFGYRWLAAIKESKDLARVGVEKSLLKAEIANLCMQPTTVEKVSIESSPKILLNRHSLRTAANLLRQDPTGLALLRATMNLIRPKAPTKKTTWQPRRSLVYQPTSLESDWSRLTTHVHVYYLEEAAIIAQKLRKIKNLKKLIVTHSPHLLSSEIEEIFQFQDLEVLELPNQGRNFGAMVEALKFIPEDHSVLHLHTKRSLHMDRKRSRLWFLHMVNSLLEPSYLETGLSFLQSSKENWIWYPTSEHILPSRGFAWNTNTTYAKQLCLISNVPYLESQFPYPAGGMFLASPILLEKLRNLELSQEDFPEEPLALDGTLAHTLERFMGYLPRVLGMRQVFISSSGQLNLDPSFIFFQNEYDQ